MSDPRIHGKTLRASDILEALGLDLLRIKMDDKLTWAELGEVLGVSEDQAAKYADATATMNAVAYTRGRIAWNGRFTGSLDKLVERTTDHIDGRHLMTLLFECGGELARYMEDGNLTDEEIRKARKQLETLRAGIDKLLARIGPKAMSA
jgi:succinyl-CoA synthetase alpha subunit